MKIRRLSAAQAIADLLRVQITKGELSPLTRLKEADLAEQLSVSRTPLREALGHLESEGFVDRLPGGGLVVMGIHPDDVKDLFWLRAVLESAVVEEVTKTITPAELDALDQRIEEMDLLRQHPQRFLDLGREFHDQLAGLLGNHRCQTVLRQIRSHSDRYWAVAAASRPERTEFASHQHRDIVRLMRSGDARAAGAKMREHVLSEAEVCLETVQGLASEAARSREIAG